MMKKYTHYKANLLIALLSLNTLSACINTRKSLGLNITKKVMQWSIGGLVTSSTVLPGTGQPTVTPLPSCPNRPTEADKDIDIDKHIIEFVLLLDQYAHLQNYLNQMKQIQ